MGEVIASGKAVALWAGLHLLLLLVLSGLVVRQRRRHRVAIGDQGIPELFRAQRAFGNAVEYVPAGLIALAVLAQTGAGSTLVHAIGGLLFVGRLAHAVGLTITGGPSLGRIVGMVLTWVAWLVAAVSLLVFAVA